VRRLLPSFRWVPVSNLRKEGRKPREGRARRRIDRTMRELRERFREVDDEADSCVLSS
jgi:hypothetical protein